jgi:hypothetical protein
MVSKAELAEIKENLLTPATPHYTLEQLQLLLLRYTNRNPTEPLEALVMKFMHDLIVGKIQMYPQYPWYAD